MEAFLVIAILKIVINNMLIRDFACIIHIVYLVYYMEVSNIYTDTLRELRFGTRRIDHQGGQWSGKTVNILAALATLCAEEKWIGGKESRVTTVTSMSFPHLKGGALRDFEDYVYPNFKNAITKYNKTDHLFTFKGGMQMEFKVFESEMKARGQKRKRLFINEANSFPYMIYWQLDSRADQTIIDYNPTIRFWAHEQIKNQPGTVTFISDHRHNPFISESKHREIESNKDTELFKVYARGLTGNVTGVIFPNWEQIDDEDFPKPSEQDWIYSIDFGYTNDPTAIMKICKIGNTLYVKELAYETGLPPQSIKNILQSNGYKASEPLYCEHDPDMVRQLRNIGIQASLCRKGQGSINAGIELLNTYEVKYPSSSRNLHRERGMYIWSVDESIIVDGKPKQTNIPVDNNNHCFDAIRYGVYTKYLRNQLR